MANSRYTVSVSRCLSPSLSLDAITQPSTRASPGQTGVPESDGAIDSLMKLQRFQWPGLWILAQMKNAVIWYVTPCGSYRNRQFGGTCCLIQQGDEALRPRNNVSSTQQILAHIVFLRSVLRLLVTANIPSTSNLFTSIVEAIRSSETSVPTRATRRIILEGDILHSHRREYLKSYIALTG
jgi:hypothetical protein